MGASKFVQPLSGVTVLYRGGDDERLIGAASRVKAGESIDDVALEMAIEDTEAEERTAHNAFRDLAAGPPAIDALATARERKFELLAMAAFEAARRAVSGARDDQDRAGEAVAKAMAKPVVGLLLEAHVAGWDYAGKALRRDLSAFRAAWPDKNGYDDHGRDEASDRWYSSDGQDSQQLWHTETGRRLPNVNADAIVSSPLKKESGLSFMEARTKALDETAFHKLPVEEVAVDELRAWQSVVFGKNLRVFDSENAPPILVVKWRGQNIVYNGNHRAAAAWAAGTKSIKAKVLDLDETKNANKYLKPKYRFAENGLRAARKGPAAPSRARLRAADWAERHAAELVRGIDEATRDQVRFVIARLLDQDVPLTSKEARDLIAEAIGDRARAQTIARTETMRAVSAGQREYWEDAAEQGLLPKTARRVWIAAEDEALCDVCQALDGKKAKLGAQYAAGIDGPPAHPNCRCTEGLA